jgi:hypothetical protein
MKISFEDKSYIDISKSVSGKIIIVIAAKDGNSMISNSVELTKEQFAELVGFDNKPPAIVLIPEPQKQSV